MGYVMDATYAQILNGETDFHLRRAVERLREGLFDPLAVRLLTAHEDRLNKVLDQGFRALEQGRSAHLCVCGSYGQGKSHSLTYTQDRALREGFVTSMINLDPRQVPFHDFRQVYRALVAQLRFPGGETSLTARWRTWADEQQDAVSKNAVSENTVSENTVPENTMSKNGVADLLPQEMPHLFRSVLAGIAQKTVSLSPQQRQTKKHAAYRPREFPYLLSGALAGDVVPVLRLRYALKYRQVDFYKEASLTCRGVEPYVQMVSGLARLFRKMGYRGWVLLFDEGESIAQGRIASRSRSYQLLDRLFSPEVSDGGLYPVFAFTDEFFQQVEDEQYDRVQVRHEQEIPYFDKEYAKAWKGLTRYSLQDLSRQEWDQLAEKLIHLHAKAYRWKPPQARMQQELVSRLEEMSDQETRYKLKALVDQLDLVHQEQVL